MKNSTRDLSKNPPVTTTPVNYRDANTVYRSLAAVPAPLDIHRSGASSAERSLGKLVGPQTKSRGDVVWAETKQTKAQQGEAQPCPIPLIVAQAPHHSMFVESNPVSKVVSAVSELFTQQNVDAMFNSGKFKWKCACYDGDAETRFVSRLFSVPGKANFFVLDFQRRSGDPFHFQSIYKAINFRLLKSGFIVCNDAKAESKIEEPVFRTFKPLSLPDDFFGEEDESSAADVEPLVRMCCSPYVDVQREGLSALTAQLETSEAARKAVLSFAGKLMEIISLTRDMQVRRLAASAISKLSTDESAAQVIAGRGGIRVLVNVMLSSSETLETRRHCASALLKSNSMDAQSKSMILSAAMSSDARLDQSLRELQTRHAV